MSIKEFDSAFKKGSQGYEVIQRGPLELMHIVCKVQWRWNSRLVSWEHLTNPLQSSTSAAKRQMMSWSSQGGHISAVELAMAKDERIPRKMSVQELHACRNELDESNNSVSGGQRLFMPMRHHARMMKYPETPQTKRPPSISLPICPSLMKTYGIRCHWPWINLAPAPSPRIDLWRLRGPSLAFLESPQWTESEFPDCQKRQSMYTGSEMDGASRFASAGCEQESLLLLRVWPGIIGLISSCEKASMPGRT
ncbi:hypothetical protein AUP68_11732 [Ilyonectria robusta]